MYLREIEKSIKQPCALWHRQHFSNPDAPQIGITVPLRTMGGPGSGVPVSESQTHHRSDPE